jgi:hypothetical protein
VRVVAASRVVVGIARQERAHATLAAARLGLYPIVTFQYRSTTLYQVPYHIRSLFF